MSKRCRPLGDLNRRNERARPSRDIAATISRRRRLSRFAPVVYVERIRPHDTPKNDNLKFHVPQPFAA
jgi:hypothetical protein